MPLRLLTNADNFDFIFKKFQVAPICGIMYLFDG